MSKLKELNYILVKYVDNQRRIYLNLEKITTKVSSEVAENGYQGVEESFYHKRNNKKEIHKKGMIKKWKKTKWKKKESH